MFKLKKQSKQEEARDLSFFLGVFLMVIAIILYLEGSWWVWLVGGASVGFLHSGIYHWYKIKNNPFSKLSNPDARRESND